MDRLLRSETGKGVLISTVEEYGSEVTRAQPDPPRKVQLWPVLYRCYGSRSGRVVTAAGVALGVPGSVAAALAAGSVASKLILIAIVWGVTAILIASPGVRGWRALLALRYGEVADGRVVRSAWTGPSLRAASVDAQTHGLARGTWKVDSPAGVFEAAFESDAPWARRLEPGTKVRLLVDPVRLRVLMDLGPTSED
jgi:hypothetical protein